MNDNWHHVKEIFVDALRLKSVDRSKFIEERCSGDMGLRAEVESLLSSHDSSESFLESPAVGEVAEVLASDSSELKDGDFLKHYRIVKKIGVGGMGEVYLASDTKLGRKVAIKILSDSFESGQSNLKRFFLEAKAASGLNHPNIMVVHEIGEFDGTHYIASEYVEGETLSEVIRNRNLSLIEIVDISTQIASALDAAHEVGVIHRDIKADNLMLRADGIVKVLDFGLVKMAEKKGSDVDFDAATQELMNTRDGMILGTAAYMSPEQARGKPVDQRTDIWSFGVVLYQIITRALPFPGETPSDIIASILKSEPRNIAKYVSEIPVGLEAIVKKSLQKNASERYSSASELLEDIKLVKHKLEFGENTKPLNYRISNAPKHDLTTDGTLTAVTAGPSGARERIPESYFITSAFNEARARPGVLALVLASVALLLTAGYFGVSWLTQTAAPVGSFQNMELKKLTREGSAGYWSAVSPDGKYVAYIVKSESKQSLEIGQVESSGVVKIASPANSEYAGLTFAPDGNDLYYTAKEKGESRSLYRVSVLGGNSRKLIDGVDESVAFSPNGEKIAFVRGRTSLVTTDAKGSNERILSAADKGEGLTYLAWSNDGKSIFTAGYSKTDPNYHLVELDAQTGNEKWRSDTRWRTITGVSTLNDGAGIILSARDLKSTRLQLWFLPYPTGEPRRITNDLSNYYGVRLTADNNSLVSVKLERTVNIWTSEYSNSAMAKRITTEEGQDEGLAGVAVAPDGKIIYTARETGDYDIWSVDADGSNRRKLTADEGSNEVPAVSPDGKTIVFSTDRASNGDLWRMDIDGRNQTALTTSPEHEGYTNITPDGKWIVYEKVDSDNKGTIWKISIDGGTPAQLTKAGSWRPTLSPDGKFFACDYGSEKNAKVAIFPIEGGSPVKVIDAPAILKSYIFKWASDGKSLIYFEKRDRAENLWSQPIDGSPPKQLTNFDSGEIYRFDVANNGDGFILARGRTSSDVVLINNFR